MTTDAKILNLEERYSVEAPERITFAVQLPDVTGSTDILVFLQPSSGSGTSADGPIVTVSEQNMDWAPPVEKDPANYAANLKGNRLQIAFKQPPSPDRYVVRVVRRVEGGDDEPLTRELFEVVARRELADVVAIQGSLPASLQRGPAAPVSLDERYWVQILAASEAFSFGEYSKYIDDSLASSASNPRGSATRAYELLKEASERFVFERSTSRGLRPYIAEAAKEAHARLERATVQAPGAPHVPHNIAVAAANLPRTLDSYVTGCVEEQPKVPDSCMLELIWSYWQEEGGLVQTLKAITRRFQNRRDGSGRDPLVNLDIDPLRPLSQYLWGLTNDEINRLSVLRRAHEYQYRYGLALKGKAVVDVRPADRRSKFLESFHNLLACTAQLYRRLDDLTVRPDGFRVLNAIKETHYLVAQAAGNQFGDLDAVARQEMLLDQWVLARPEMLEFLRARPMVPYPERWMGPADHMKSLKGWTDTSVVQFRDLAICGEKILLSIRNGSWSVQKYHEVATSWARFFRPEVQVYISAYQAVTGVDLESDASHPRQLAERYAMPSEHLQRRLALQVAASR